MDSEAVQPDGLEFPPMIRFWKSTTLAFLLGVLGTGSAWGISLEEAARKVAEEHDARVLSAKTVTVDGRRVHEIRIVDAKGVVRTVRVPESD